MDETGLFFIRITTKSTFHQKGQDILCRKKTFQGENNCVLIYKVKTNETSNDWQSKTA